LTYAASGLPGGLSINSSTGLISGTISSGAVSSSPYTVTVTASDGFGASASRTITWSVGNVALDNPGGQTYQANESVSLPMVAHDNDADTLTYSVTGLPAGLSVSGSHILGTVAASAVSATPYNIVETVTNSLSQTATAAFTMLVGDAPPKDSTFNLSAWNDMNRDWTRQSMEPGVGGVQATLYNSDGVAVAKPITDHDGVDVLGLAAGEYALGVSVPASYSLWNLSVSGVTASGSPLSLSLDPTTHRTKSFEIAYGSTMTLNVALKRAKDPTGQIVGPSVVPGNSSYVYAVDFSGVVSGVHWTAINPAAPQSGVIRMGNFSSATQDGHTSEAVQLWFGNGAPATVKLTLHYGAGLTISTTITVVQVQITDPELVKNVFATNPTPLGDFPVKATFGDKKDRAAIGVDTKIPGIPGKKPPTPGIELVAFIELAGPNGNQGVDKINVGFIQHCTYDNVQALYQNPGETLTGKYKGKPFSDYTQTLDKANPAALKPWALDPSGVFSNAQPDGPTTSVILFEDSPSSYVPLTYDQDPATVYSLNTWPDLDLVKKMVWTDKFSLDVAAATIDEGNGASSLYYADASAPWAVYGSGTFKLVLNVNSRNDSTVEYQQATNPAVVSPTSWATLLVTSPTLEKLSGPVANDVVHSPTFS
jgi:hypothetical protein